MRKIFTRLLVVLFVISLSSVLNAQIESGKIYNIVNVGNSGYSLAAVSITTNSIVATDETDYSQLWYVGTGTADGSYTVRNLSNGFYLQTSWGFATTPADLYCVTAGSDYTLSASNNSNGYDNMHYGANQGYVVGWTTAASATQWQFNEVAIDAAILQTNWNEIEALEDSVSNCATYQGLLDNIFSDKACTTFNSGYSYSTTETNYSSLPYGLKKMVAKVNSDNWAEDNADNTKAEWEHSYAKRFRLQMYEPYSIAGDITSWLRMNTHANNDNPTGVYVNGRGLIYVMVEGEIKEGATLRLIDAGHNHRIGDATTGGYELKSGLNVIPCYGTGGHLYVCYNVDTYNADGTDAATRFPENRRLSNYPPLKIHIEGGAINGFYNAQGDFRATTEAEDMWKTITGYSVDCDADWVYMETRANLNVLPILAHRQILLFQLNDWGSDPGMKTLLPDQVTVPTTAYSRTGSWDEYNMRLDPTSCKINIMMEAWDRIMYSEHATLGLVSQSTMNKMNEMYPRWNSDGSTGDIYTYDEAGADGKTYTEFCGVDYSEHFNHHGVGLGTESGYMSAGGQHCNYHINTFSSIVGQIASNAGSLWGPAHEIGHQHQGVFNIRGGTEATNNVFSNAAVWYMGMATSRVNGTQGCLSNVLAEYNAGKPFIDYDIWAMTQLFYKLWLYYHLAGNNTQFYPRFFEMLRVDPLNATGGTATGTDSMLKIYEKMCEAAGEDLTEFFRIHGFFVLLDNYAKDDYSITVFTQTQEEVDAAIKRVKDKGYEENLTVILINDGTEESSVAHDGTTKRALWDAASAEFGAVGGYIDGETSITAAYTASVSADGTVTMAGGEGGVGFLVLDEDGKVVSFSNNSSFQLSDEAAYLLVTGKATISAIDSNNEKTAAEVDMRALQQALLSDLVTTIKALPIDDSSYTHVGFYTASCAGTLLAALEQAELAITNASGYEAAYELLYTEYQAFLKRDDYTFVPFDPSLTYIITNYAYDQTMFLNSSQVVKSGTTSSVDHSATTSQWKFVETSTAGVYYIQNVSNNYYLPAVVKSTNMTATADAASDAIYTVEETGIVGVWTLCLSPTGEFTNLHAADNNTTEGRVVGWSIDGDATKWYLTATSSPESNTTVEKDKLAGLVAKTNSLVNAVAEITYTISDTPVDLQVTNASNDYYVRTNATNTGSNSEGPITNLVDGLTDNFFHTQWANNAVSDDGLAHYIEVSMGSGALSAFNFSYTTRADVDNDYPQVIEVYGSNTENKDGDESEYVLLTTISSGLPKSKTQSSYASSAIDAGIAYKYLRFMVPTTSTTRKNETVQHNYWHMAEFDISQATAAVTQREGFTGISAETILTAYNAMNAGSSWYKYQNINSEQLSSAYSTLESAYNTLKTAYDNVIKAKKEELETLADSTDVVIASVGGVVFGTVTPITMQCDDETAEYYLYCNSVLTSDGQGVAGLLDDSETTFLHTNNSGTSEDDLNHYLRLDLGEGNSTESFKFAYQNRTPSSYKVFPKVLKIEGSNDKDSNYETIVEISSGLPETVGGTYESQVLGNGNAYRYIRFMVTETYANNSTPPYFCMAKFSFTAVKEIDVTIETAYDGIVSEDLLLSTRYTSDDSHFMAGETSSPTLAQLEAQITKLTDAKAALEAAKENVNKSELETLLASAKALYEKMADANGNVNTDYAASTLVNQNLADALAQITAAQEVVDYAGSKQADVNAAKSALNEKYQVLLAVENTNEKSTLATTDLQTLIDNVKTLLGTIATDATDVKSEIALQATASDDNYYIWCNSPASDSQGVAGLIDNNADGTPNTSTFLGTSWGSVVDAFTHYIEVDLGASITIDKLLFDYTTRATGFENQRPTAIRILGSNNKVDYTEVITINSGLATGECEKWEMSSAQELALRYRYIRFAVATQETTGYFNMSDFTLYALINKQLNDYYTTATGLGFDELCLALQSAEDVIGRAYITTEHYTAVYNKLSTCYTTANTVVNADYKTRDDLTTLIANTETLIESVATVTDVPEITLSTSNVYCNADGTTNSSPDNKGEAALLDNDVTTHLHTSHSGNAQDDDEHHYIRVDMGEGNSVASFKFSYKGRNENSNAAPTDMLVQACNTTDGEWVTVETLTGLPTGDAPVTYESELIEMPAAYRYVRFMVTATKNNGTTTYNNIAHKYFVMSEFGFEPFVGVVVKDGYPRVTTELVGAAYNEKNSATAANGYYMTESEYNATLAALQADYDALDAATKTDKTALEELIEATTSLKNDLYEMAVTSYNAEKVTLSATEGDAGWLYCNAEGSTNNYAGDNAGVAALLDNDTDTSNFLHTTYYGDDNDDGLDHYLRVDLGDGGATDYIQFRYTGRSAYPDLTPSTAVIEATNDLAGEWAKITTLTGLEATTNEVLTGCLGNGNTYRYWRFMVTATHDGRVCDEHPYFALSAFNVDKCTDVVIESQLKYTPDIYIYTTSELVTEVEDAITAATAVKDNADATQTEVDVQVEALQAVYDKLEEALKYAGIPITITTDENNPVLYKIISKRDDNGGKVLQFDEPASDKVAIVDVADNASYQAWYFMKGTNGYLIKPFNGDGKVLGVSSTRDAQASATIAETATYAEWNFARSTVSGCTDYFYIYVNGTSHACLSHNGGFDATDKMGIWSNGWNTNDGGSLFKFVDAEFENDNARFYQLSDFENTLEFQTSTTPEGTTVGAFTNGDAYSTAYSTAATLIEAGNTSDATACKEAYTALRAANSVLVHHLPEVGKIYRIYITPGLTDDRAGASMRINDDGKLACGVYNIANAHYYFTFEYDTENNLYMKNLHSATYVDEAPASGNNIQVGADAEAVADAKAITISTLGKSGETVVVGITPTSGGMLNCAAKDGNVVAFDNTAVDKASAWVIEEVEIATVEANVVHSVSLANNTQGDETTKRYSTLCLGYPVTLPADSDVQAYIATDVDDNNVIVLTLVGEDGKTIPANTPVILKSDTGVSTVAASFSTDEAAAVDEETNLLGGTTYTTYVCCLDEAGTNNVSNVYMLTRKNGLIAMRWMYENYLRNDDGTYSKHQNASSDDGGYVRCPANKAYLKLTSATQSLSTEYYFGFFGGTTDIDKVNTEENPLQGTIYDLQGRKIEEVTVPGFYIVNGKKMFVNSELLK